MSRPDSVAIDEAILAVLRTDAALAAAMPGGVWFSLAPEGLDRFVLVVLEPTTDVAEFGRRAQEQCRYQITAAGLSGTHPAIQAAMQRIDVLLEDRPLTIDGYAWSTTYRDGRHRLMTRETNLDRESIWEYGIAWYRVDVAPIWPPAPGPSLWVQTVPPWTQAGWMQ